jgi:hypothetical protein
LTNPEAWNYGLIAYTAVLDKLKDDEDGSEIRFELMSVGHSFGQCARHNYMNKKAINHFRTAPSKSYRKAKSPGVNLCKRPSARASRFGRLFAAIDDILPSVAGPEEPLLALLTASNASAYFGNALLLRPIIINSDSATFARSLGTGVCRREVRVDKCHI